MRWSTTSAAAVLRLCVTPSAGLALLFWEASRDEPRFLILVVALVLLGLVPASAIFEGRAGRPLDSQPGTAAPPAPPVSPPESPSGTP